MLLFDKPDRKNTSMRLAIREKAFLLRLTVASSPWCNCKTIFNKLFFLRIFYALVTIAVRNMNLVMSKP